MDFRLIYTKPAEQDLFEIVRHISQDSPKAAADVGLKLGSSVSGIRSAILSR